MKITKQNIKTIAIGLLCTVLGTTLTVIVFADTDLKVYEDNYINAVHQLHIAQNNKCLAEREFANVKLEKYLDKDLNLSKSDLLRLMEKSKWDCGETIENLQMLTEKKISQKEAFNLDCWAKAVATAETGDCTNGMGLTKNNCFGIMTYKNGYREGKTYNSKEESYNDFKMLWKTKYNNSLPTLQTIKKYTGNDNPLTWQKNTMSTYNLCINK